MCVSHRHCSIFLQVKQVAQAKVILAADYAKINAIGNEGLPFDKVIVSFINRLNLRKSMKWQQMAINWEHGLWTRQGSFTAGVVFIGDKPYSLHVMCTYVAADWLHFLSELLYVQWVLLPIYSTWSCWPGDWYIVLLYGTCVTTAI